MKRPRTLRGRLFLAVLLSVAAALAVMTLVFNLLLWRSLSADADRAARTRAQAEISAFDISTKPNPLDEPVSRSEMTRADSTVPNGSKRERSPSSVSE